MLQLEDILTRADDYSLQEILGEKILRILSTLDQTRAYNRYLRSSILKLHGAEGLLLDRSFRAILFDLLREPEAKALSQILGVRDFKNTLELYNELRELRIRRGSRDEENLFRFFNLCPPEKETKVEAPSVKARTGQYQLFDHQRTAAREVEELLNTEPFRVLLHMPTGSGKTRTAMNVIANHFREYEPSVVVWLASSEELCEQAVEEFEKAWSFLGDRQISVHRYWGSHELDIEKLRDGFVVAGLSKMVSTIRGNGGINFIGKLAARTSLVVMDEAHQAIAPTYKIVLDTLFHVGKENRLLGLSATPGRTWNDVQADKELADFFDRRKVRLEVKGYTNPIEYLVDEGYLAKVNYKNLLYEQGKISPKDLEAIKESIDIPLSVLKALGEDDQRNLKIIYEIEKLSRSHKRIILFAPSVYSSNMLACVLQARGHQANSVTGETQPVQRKRLIEDFKDSNHETKIICNYGILTTGFDAPQTSAAVIARPTTSLVLYSQMIGRAMRGVKAGGNLEAEIVTIIDGQLPGFRNVAESFDNWEDVW